MAPVAANRVLARLKEFGSIQPSVRFSTLPREGPMNKVPLKTDQEFFIIDAPFPTLLTKTDVAAGKDGSGKGGVWEVNELAHAIKQIAGVLEVGIFSGHTGTQASARGSLGGQRPVAAYFGMADGSVSSRKAAE